ncbi:MAG: alpha/beta fold hydrolase [Deltaproteobacteria bacterium]|nr:alpha/beta fold hydrolase [Deltaproteobacteria bacterium]
MALGDPFDLVGDGAIGAVLVHGFTGTPYEMQYLGEQLARAGITVHGLRLPGHGTRVEDLDRTTYRDWADAVEDAFDSLRLMCGQVAVVGQSLGGLLSLHLAAHRPDVAAVATLAAPLWLDGLAGRVADWAARGALRWPAIPKLARSDVRDPAVRRENPCYDEIPTKALGELARFMKLVGGELDQIRAPVLVLHGRRDHTAPVACAARIAARTNAVRTRILPRSYHLIAADVERDIVAAEVIDFIRRNVGVKRGELSCAM